MSLKILGLTIQPLTSHLMKEVGQTSLQQRLIRKETSIKLSGLKEHTRKW